MKIFPEHKEKKIASAMMIRQKSDYDDFYLASKKDAKEQVEVADAILNLADMYLDGRI